MQRNRREDYRRTQAFSRSSSFRTTISLSVAHFSAPRVLLVFGVREYAWTRISRLARMVNFCKQELPFYWASSATLLPPAPSQPLSLSLPHFTATPNATIGIPNRFRDHSAPLFQRAGVVGAVNVESFHAPSPRPPPLFFPATLEKDNQRLLASIPPPFHLRPPLIYAVLQIFAFTFFPFLAPPPFFLLLPSPFFSFSPAPLSSPRFQGLARPFVRQINYGGGGRRVFRL